MSTRGFTLMELLVALSISAFMVTGLVTLVQASAGSFQLQQGLGQMQESARFATGMISSAIHQAGYKPQPWLDDGTNPGIAPSTEESYNITSDHIVLRRWSDRNCYDNANPSRDGNGVPLHFLMETGFFQREDGSLVQSCRYGPDAGQLVTQVNNLGLAEQVEAFQVQYAEDTNGDGNANRWVRAGQWQEENRIKGVRFALLLASPTPLATPESLAIEVLDQMVRPAADGKLRRVYLSGASLNGRAQ